MIENNGIFYYFRRTSKVKYRLLLQSCNELRRDNEKKDIFIARLNRITVDFEDEVFEAESKYEEKIKEFKATIDELNKQLLKIRKINDNNELIRVRT